MSLVLHDITYDANVIIGKFPFSFFTIPSAQLFYSYKYG